MTERWREAGLISGEQAHQILEFENDRASGRTFAAIAAVAGVLIVAGIILIVAANWNAIGNLTKLVLLLALQAGVFLGAMQADRRGLRTAWRELLWLVAASVPLAALALVSQMFHVHGDIHVLFAAWLLLILPLPFLTASLSTWVALIAASFCFFTAWVVQWDYPREVVSEFIYPLFFCAYGVALAAVSRLWLLVGDWQRHAVGRYLGVLTALIAGYVLGFFVEAWPLTWLGLFVICCALIHFGFKSGRANEVNAAFFTIFLIIFGTYLRLLGSMRNTGLVFIGGGLLLLALMWLWSRVKNYLRTVYQNKEG